MRAVAISRVAAATQARQLSRGGQAPGHGRPAGRGTRHRSQPDRVHGDGCDGRAHRLPGGCADIVTASQAMHWFDAGRALPEIARVLRPGGGARGLRL